MNRCWTTRVKRALGVAVVAPLVLAATASGQEPSTTSASAQTCSDPTLAQPFSALGDVRDYVLAPGGAFEDPEAPGWTLEGGAEVVSAANPFVLGDASGSGSLSLPEGASAVSPTMCVDLRYPTMRFVASQLTAKDSKLDVDVLYPETNQQWTDSTNLRANSADGWHATEDVALRPEKGGKTSSWRLVALRFSAEQRGTWLIDDVFVDPRMK